jgi:hypothetical protein
MYDNVVQPVQELSAAQRIFPGGVCDIFFTPIENVLTWPVVNPETGGIDDEIILREGTVLHTADFNNPTQRFQEETKKSQAGTHHEFLISATLPGNVNENVLTLGTMLFHRYLVVFKEKNGVWRFLGNEDSGAEISYQYTSGDRDSSRNRNIRITWSHPNPAPIYLGSLTEVPVSPTGGGSFMLVARFKVKTGQPMQPGESTYSNSLLEDKYVFMLINREKVPEEVNDMEGEQYVEKDLESNTLQLLVDGDPSGVIENDIVEIYVHD